MPATLMLVAVFLIAICGLVYELIAGTLASYLLGDSVTQFSLVIGMFLSAMGLGSYLSKFIREHLVAWFVGIEIAVGVLGGLAAVLGFAAFAYTESYTAVLCGSTVAIGVLVGLEIPLVLRLLEEVRGLRLTVANVFTADYLGALGASLLFPFLLLPYLGLVQAGLWMGLCNVLVGLVLFRALRSRITAGAGLLRGGAFASVLVLVTGLLFAKPMLGHFESRLYQDEIVLSRDTGLQRLTLTHWRGDVRLYLNGALQFSSVDEYRYHEALCHPAMSQAERRDRVLVLGGGDGLLCRQILKYPDVQRIDLCDLDPGVTSLAREHSMLREINGDSLRSSKVRIHNQDAMRFLDETETIYDLIFIDLPDPRDPALAKLYSSTFYRLASRRLARHGILTTQATSPFRSREAFWCIHNTLAATEYDGLGKRLKAKAYHCVVPTFGTWGFVMAARHTPRSDDLQLGVEGRFLDTAAMRAMFAFGKDMGPVETAINRLDDPVLSRLYLDGYHRYLN